MVMLSIIQYLTIGAAEEILQQEGYIEENCIEQQSTECDRLFLYPHSLYEGNGRLLDCIYYVEYCNQIMDEEYIDGRMTWEAFKTEWRRKS